MSATHSPLRKGVRTDVLSCLTAGRRRRLLRRLRARGGAAPVAELARELAADERETDPGSVDGDAVRSVRVSLRHAHLPKLDEKGLVAWDREAGTVAPADREALDDDLVRTLLDGRGDAWDEIVGCLADDRRRPLLAELAERDGPAEPGALAAAVAEREAAGEPAAATVRDVERSLRHVHLPKLDGAGLVDHDRDADTVAYRGHSGLPDLRTA